MEFKPEVEEKIKPLLEKFKEEMKKEGFSEAFIEKAINRAKKYVFTLSSYLDSANPELVAKAQVEMMPEALEHSKRWMRAFKEAVGG
ncbi:MAG: hypothetical protein ABIK75_07085 [candidate division WOR-3 bacterium]